MRAVRPRYHPWHLSARRNITISSDNSTLLRDTLRDHSVRNNIGNSNSMPLQGTLRSRIHSIRSSIGVHNLPARHLVAHGNHFLDLHGARA